MLKAFNTYNLDAPNKFLAYATRIMENEILMQFRKERRHEGVFSLDAMIATSKDNNKDISFLDMTPDEAVDIEKQCINTEIIRLIKEHAEHILSKKEHIMMLDKLSDNPKTQRELSQELGISQARISRLQTSAMKKLRHFLENKNTHSINRKKPIKKEKDNMESLQHAVTAIPEGTLYDKIKFLHDQNPEVTKQEIASILNCNKNSVAAYLSKIKNETTESSFTQEPVKEEVVFVFQETPAHTPTSSSSPALIELTMEEVSGQAIQHVLSSLIPGVLQESDTYKLAISITK